MPPKVCTYIPNYNYHSKGFLIPCLDSAISQSYGNMLLLAIDDGSTDGSQEVIQSYTKKDPRLTFIAKEHWSKTRRGQGWLNEAFKWARERDCEFFSILDSDDLYEPDFWELSLPYFSKPRIGFIRIGLWMFGDNMETKWLKPKAWNHRADILAENKVFISSPFRMSMQRQVGDWDDNISWSDWDFWTRCVLNYGWDYATCNEPLFRYRRHESQLAYSSAREKNKELIDYMQNKYKAYLPGMPVTNMFGRKFDEDKNKSTILTSN